MRRWVITLKARHTNSLLGQEPYEDIKFIDYGESASDAVVAAVTRAWTHGWDVHGIGEVTTRYDAP